MDVASLFQDIVNNWQFIDAGRFINAALALLLACVVGGLTGPRLNSALPLLWRPVAGTFGVLARRLNRTKRNEGSRIFRGFFLTMLLVLFAGATGIWLGESLQGFSQGRLMEILILSFCITSGAVWTHVLAVIKTVKGTKKIPGTYLVLSRSSRIDLSGRDDFTITRTAAELLVRLFDKACVAPLIWYVLTGLPGVLIYSALSAYVWSVGYDETRAGVGTVASAMEKLLGFVPSALAASLLAVTTLLVPTSGPVSAMKAMMSNNKHPYGEGGAPLTILAHALSITLGGPVTHLDGVSVSRKWTGPDGATAQLSVDHLKRVLYMVIIAHIYFHAALIGGSLWAQLTLL